MPRLQLAAGRSEGLVDEARECSAVLALLGFGGFSGGVYLLGETVGRVFGG